MPDLSEPARGQLPPPWDRIFGLGTRLFVWGLIAGIIYLLRPFFLLVFLTFVFAYIQDHGVDGLAHRIRTRWIRVVLVFAVFLGTLVAIGIFLVPHVQQQIETVAREYPKWINTANTNVVTWANEHGLKGWLPTRVPKEGQEATFSLGDIIADLLGVFSDEQGGKVTVSMAISFMQGVAGSILGILSAFFLSLLFSFLIVLDLPKLARGIRSLANTKIGFIYAEVADSVYSFCKVLGRAMEAQLFIAICNTVFTAIGLWVIGIGEGNTVFLCTIVFLCSFIPVAGVFISSTPIGIAALTEGGLGLLFLAIGMILIIHFIEAYFLNPKIYGHHLRMNPVLTLIILTVCGKLFGPWGLILGIPVFNYVFTHAIRYRGVLITEEDRTRGPDREDAAARAAESA